MGRALAFSLFFSISCGSIDAVELLGPDAPPSDDTEADRTGSETGSPGATLDGGPPYPIVLAHGFFGFERFAGVDFATYFHGVKDELARAGEADVHTPAVDPFNDSTHRGMQLLERVEAILLASGKRKVNIIGHSQGGLDARVVAHSRPDLVASVVSIGSPHHGVHLTRFLYEGRPSEPAAELADWITRLAGAPLYDEIGDETSVSKAMRQFTPEAIERFNATYPDREGVAYFSIAGRTDLHDGGEPCMVPEAPSFIRTYEGVLDPVDPLLRVAEDLTDESVGRGAPNDGFVRVEDASWGRFLGCVPADHLDQIGQVLGDDPGLANTWTHGRFFVELTAHLRDLGH